MTGEKRSKKGKEKVREQMKQMGVSALPISQNLKLMNGKECLQKFVVAEWEAMDLNRAYLDIHSPPMQEFIRKQRSRLLEIAHEKKKSCQYEPTLFDGNLLYATNDDYPESSHQGRNRKKRKAFSSFAGEEENIDPVSDAPALLSLPPPAMPTELVNEIRKLGGEDVGWVIGKRLLKTDLSRSHDRVSIPRKQVKLFEDGLTRKEKDRVFKGIATEVDVLVWDNGDKAQPKVWTLNFCWWEMTGYGIFLLRTHWWKLVEYHCLQEGDELQMWSFRQSRDGGDEKNLSFAINVLRRKGKKGGWQSMGSCHCEELQRKVLAARLP